MGASARQGAGWHRKGGERIYIIAGIDPGIKTGYAFLDLSGRVVASGSFKEAGEERLIRLISASGTAVLLASDKVPAPRFVAKLAARLGVRVFVPRHSLTKMEKRMMGKDILDPHVRDAYSAALKAFRQYSNRIRQIDALAIENKNELKRMIIRGERIAHLMPEKGG